MMTSNLNLNRRVRVNLTPAGKKMLKEYYSAYGMSVPDSKDGDSWTGPLWELAHIFGLMLYMGSTNLPFESMDMELV